MIKPATKKESSDVRLWWIVMVDLETGERNTVDKAISTNEAIALFKSWEAKDLDERKAIPMFWPASHPLPVWLLPSDQT